MSSSTLSLQIYDLLNTQFGQPERARALTEAIETLMEEKVTSGNKNYEALLHKDLEIVRTEFKKEIEVLRAEMKEGFAKADEKTARSENKIILWIVGYTTALAGLIFALIKLL